MPPKAAAKKAGKQPTGTQPARAKANKNADIQSESDSDDTDTDDDVDDNEPLFNRLKPKAKPKPKGKAGGKQANPKAAAEKTKKQSKRSAKCLAKKGALGALLWLSDEDCEPGTKVMDELDEASLKMGVPATLSTVLDLSALFVTSVLTYSIDEDGEMDNFIFHRCICEEVFPSQQLVLVRAVNRKTGEPDCRFDNTESATARVSIELIRIRTPGFVVQ